MTLGFASEDLTVGPTVREFCPILKLVFKLNFRPKFFILIVDVYTKPGRANLTMYSLQVLGLILDMFYAGVLFEIAIKIQILWLWVRIPVNPLFFGG